MYVCVPGSGASPSPHAAVHPRAVQYALHVPWRRSRRSSNSSCCLRPGSAATPPTPKEPLQPGTALAQVVKWLLFTENTAQKLSNDDHDAAALARILHTLEVVPYVNMSSAHAADVQGQEKIEKRGAPWMDAANCIAAFQLKYVLW